MIDITKLSRIYKTGTRFMSIHLANAIYYITDGEKAQDDILVRNHNCNADIAFQEILVNLYKAELNKENESTIN